MIFWDTSAVVPLLVEEPASVRLRALAKADARIVVWWGTKIECASALARLERAGTLSPAACDNARAVLAVASDTWSEVLAGADVREEALRLLRRYALRSADALQLA